MGGDCGVDTSNLLTCDIRLPRCEGESRRSRSRANDFDDCGDAEPRDRQRDQRARGLPREQHGRRDDRGRLPRLGIVKRLDHKAAVLAGDEIGFRSRSPTAVRALPSTFTSTTCSGRLQLVDESSRGSGRPGDQRLRPRGRPLSFGGELASGARPACTSSPARTRGLRAGPEPGPPLPDHRRDEKCRWMRTRRPRRFGARR